MKILFIVPHPFDTAPSQRLKFEQYFDYFKEQGIEIEFSPFISPGFRKILYERGHVVKKVFYTICGYLRRIKDIFKARKCDLIYIHLWATPFGPPIFEYIFHGMKKPIIYDIDDMIYLPHSSKVNKFVQFLKFPQKVPRVMSLSDHIIVVTKHLKQFAESFNSKVTYIPPTINTDTYFIKDRDDNKKVCIGWTGSHSSSVCLELLAGVLRKIHQKYDINIKVIGDRNFRVDGVDIEAKDWSSKTEVEDIQGIDIGLYPLPINEWIMGKGGLKPVQYMGMGIPVVCTKIGAVLDFVVDGENGFLADNDEEWIDKISRLIEDAQLRKRVGLNGRKTVEEKFSVKVNAPKYLEIIKKVYK
ncbi:glycosyltransferase family 4 protein [Candidatus Omnitrophota bacterium]